VIVVACPGQGSQTPGFLTPWLSEPAFRDYLAELSAYAGIDLIEHGTVSDAETIRDTAVAQPLIVAASLMSFRALSQRADVSSIAVTGHSVGEFAAAALAGVLTDEEAMQLVRARGLAMAEAAQLTPSGMSAVVGGDEDAVLAAISAAGLEPANLNGGGQIVAAGSLANLATLAETPPAGARVIALQVAGAFHTSFMQPAVEALRMRAASVTPSNPNRRLYTNSDGSTVESGERFVELLISQVSSPVRWNACMSSFLDDGITGFVELLPGGALTGIAKRAMKGIPAAALKTPDDLDTAASLVSEHASN
jgi:[acyl-carrier-protein] S-malonyltransferase